VEPEEWDAFCGICHQKYGFHPETEGVYPVSQEEWRAFLEQEYHDQYYNYDGSDR